MSEKEKMKSEEIAKVLAENPTAKIYLAGLAQGMKLAKSMEPCLATARRSTLGSPPASKANRSCRRFWRPTRL